MDTDSNAIPAEGGTSAPTPAVEPAPLQAKELYLWVSAGGGIGVALLAYLILWALGGFAPGSSALRSGANVTLALAAFLLFGAAGLQAMSHQRLGAQRQNAELVGKFLGVAGAAIVMVGSGIAADIALSSVVLGVLTIVLVVLGAFLLGRKLRAAINETVAADAAASNPN